MAESDNRLALYFVIVNDGDAHKVIEIAHETGLRGATVFYGLGTNNKGFLAAIGLADVKKEIVLLCAGTELGDAAAQAIHDRLQMHRPRKGIIFSILLEALYGSTLLSPLSNRSKKEIHMENQAIFTIVEKGNAELVIDAAAAAGATGGTIINARGSGIHDTKKIFKIPIEPEKEIVLTIAPACCAEAIATAIRTKLRIDEPGRGIIFVTDVQSAYGLFKK